MGLCHPESAHHQDLTTALVMLENGKVFHPHPSLGRAWLKPLEDELLLWTGHDDDVADQVDVLAYAAMEATSGFKEIFMKEPFWRDSPTRNYRDGLFY